MPAVSMEVSTPTAPGDMNTDIAAGSPKQDAWDDAENSLNSEPSEANVQSAGDEPTDLPAKTSPVAELGNESIAKQPPASSPNRASPDAAGLALTNSSTSPSQLSADSGIVATSNQADSPVPTSSIASLSTRKGGIAAVDGKTQARNLNLIACEECGLICAGQSHYHVHIRSHTGERPFKCSICKVAFTQKGNLRRHYKIHSEEKPFQCPVCSYRCRRRDALNGHMRIHSDVRPYRCVYCARSYKSRQSLKEHEYQCPYKNDPIAQGRQQSSTSPSKSNTIEKTSLKMSPTRSPYAQPSQTLQRVLPTAVMPVLLQGQSSHNFSPSPSYVSQVSSANSSSSGKRKGSNPQKFTRMRDLSSNSTPRDSTSPSALISSSVASALQFMPSLLTSMMQQRQMQDNYARQAAEDMPSPQQDEAIDFSASRSSSDLARNEGNNGTASPEADGEAIPYITKRPRIDGEFVLTSATSRLNGDDTSSTGGSGFTPIKPESPGKSAFHIFQTPRRDVAAYSPSDTAYQQSEKLSGSARRKRPRYLNERITNVRNSPGPAEGRLMNDDYLNTKFSPDPGRHDRHLRYMDGTSPSSIKLTKREDVTSSGKESDIRSASPLGGLHAGDASRSGLRLFATGDGEGDIQELKAFVCPHCRCLFLDHVMFAIHAGCHGFRDPFECNVCGFRAVDRFQFQSHMARGEHNVIVMAPGDVDSADGAIGKSADESEKIDGRLSGRSAPLEDGPIALTSLASSSNALARFSAKAIVR